MGLCIGTSVGHDLFCQFVPLFFSRTCSASIKMRAFPFPLFLVRPELNLKLIRLLSNGELILPACYCLL